MFCLEQHDLIQLLETFKWSIYIIELSIKSVRDTQLVRIETGSDKLFVFDIIVKGLKMTRNDG